ncbi:MAG: peptide chain release factor 1 [Bradymonadales bacterium]|nr:peptide chain release factor 1 [Bradymonadales bacterium]
MDEKLAAVEARYQELTQKLADPQSLSDRALYQALTKEHKDLTPLVETWRNLQVIDRQIEENQDLLKDSDPEIRALARDELDRLETDREIVELQLKTLLLPRDPRDEKDVFLEIRAGTGGEEAALFASDLFRMYSRFSEARRWTVEVVTAHETEIGGYKEIIANIRGQEVFSWLKYESGVHRVQRVPTTESQGRIHTSTVTVAVLPEADEVDVKIDEKDLRIDVYRSSGPGGQSVNTTDSAVRVTHLPTGLVVTCQDEKSQHKNKARALRVLRARLYESEQEKQQTEIAATRRAQVGTGERSERIRTYNFPENRVSDHRISLTLYRLESILAGNLMDLIEPVRAHFQAEALAR